MRSTALVFAPVWLAAATHASMLDTHTWTPPFTHMHPDGKRGVSKDWKLGGHTVAQTNFVRLTPDRQSKRGAVWSRRPLGVEKWSTVLDFRISGQGKKYFGDGLALWFTTQNRYFEGEFHGNKPKFTGFGVIIDTFKNTEQSTPHKDISIVVNDGNKDIETMMEAAVGCDAKVRYYEERSDFSVLSNSRVKVLVDGNSVTVSVDEKGDGTFRDCASVDLPLEAEWGRRSHVGVTASTGQLADNHDVLSLVTFTDAQQHETFLDETDNAPAFERGLGFNKERFERLEDVVSEMKEKLDYLHHHFEHELAAVEDHMKVTVGKLDAKEDVAEARIAAIEAKLRDSISSDVHGRISVLTDIFDDQVKTKIADAEAGFKSKFEDLTSMAASAGGGGGWKLPFLLLFAMMAAAGAALYRWYQKLKKTHML